MIIVLLGPDSFRRHERIEVLQQAFQKKFDRLNLGSTVLTSTTVTPDAIRSALLSVGLFSEKRFTVITDALAWTEALQEVVLDSLQRCDDNSIVVITADAWPKKITSLAAWLQQQARVEEFAYLPEVDLRRWIQQRVQQAQATIDPAAVMWLVQAIGAEDLWTLHNTLQQLVHFTNVITLKTVQEFVSSPLDDNIFHFTDALSNGQTAVALRLLHEQLATGASPYYLLTMLARQVNIMIRVKETGGQGTDVHPFVIKKVLPRVQSMALIDLQKLYNQLVEIDRTSKTTSLDPVVQLDQFIVTATQK